MTLQIALLPSIESLAREAGASIMDIYARDFSVDFKADASPLTVADLAANRIITAGLKAITPEIPILSEEAVEDFHGPNAQSQYWLVDPLDGTKEFVKKNGEFTVNIALIEEGRPILGVVFAPALQTLYAAAEGTGAFKTDVHGNRTDIHTVPHLPNTAWKVVGSRSHGGDMSEWISRLDGEVEFIPMGSSLKICLVAEGAAHLYPRLGPTSLWDTAAAQCVVEQAGGQVLQLDGQILSYARPSQRLNPFFVACCPPLPGFAATNASKCGISSR